MQPWPKVLPCGDQAALVRLGEGVDPEVNRRVHRLAAALGQRRHPAVREVVPGYDSLLVEYDPLRLRWADLLRLIEEAAGAGEDGEATGRVVEIPVLYGGEAGPDLPWVAEQTGLSPEEVIRRHAAGRYRVYCLGFSPGFPYLGSLDPALRVPRLPDPRPRVPAGSVGIAGDQTGIYPAETPGGWRLIGRTPLRLFDPWREEPFLLRPGDEVRFVPVDPAAFQRLAAAQPEPVRPGIRGSGVGLRILSPGLMTTVQDLGRRGYQAYGVPVAGAVDDWALRVGNWILGNRSRAAGLEVTLTGLEVEFTGPVAFCLTGASAPAELIPAGGGSPRPVPGWTAVLAGPGDRLRVGPAVRGCRTYLCVAGGIDVPPVLGSRSEDLFAGLGPLGRPLQAGDWLPVGLPILPPADLAGRRLPPDGIPDYPPELRLRVVMGPQADRFTPEAVERLLTGEFHVGPRSNRQALELAGPSLDHRDGADIVSEGNPLGAIQVPASGRPFLLLRNRQTLGGYAKIGVVIRQDAVAAGQLPPGGRIRFQEVDLAEAHALAWAERRRLAQVRRYLLQQPLVSFAGMLPVDPLQLSAAVVPGAAPAADPAGAAGPGSPEGSPAGPRHLRIRVAGVEFDVWVEEEE
ncbi:MAG: 5-oxoprolinase subunit PxpB [Firmicutes bacterium]|nr:5-oxoprolinase subunit PxpB [Bacillota bacterium]